MVQRWPAVPTAPNSDGAHGEVEVGVVEHDDRVVAAQLEQRAAEARAPRPRATRRPMRQQPVAEISGRRRSASIALADVAAAADDEVEHAGAVVLAASPRRRSSAPRSRTAASCCDGFQITLSPHTAAIIAFHAHTATGKLNARDDADDAERMPLLVHAVARPLAVHRQAVELARQADREVADVDHLLHLAQPLGEDLAHLERDQPAERLLVLAQLRRRARARPRRAAARAPCRQRSKAACARLHDRVVVGLASPGGPWRWSRRWWG